MFYSIYRMSTVNYLFEADSWLNEIETFSGKIGKSCIPSVSCGSRKCISRSRSKVHCSFLTELVLTTSMKVKKLKSWTQIKESCFRCSPISRIVLVGHLLELSSSNSRPYVISFSSTRTNGIRSRLRGLSPFTSG